SGQSGPRSAPAADSIPESVMSTHPTRRQFVQAAGVTLAAAAGSHTATGQRPAGQEDPADRRAREVEERMTDDERFSLLISVLGHVPGSTAAATRDPRIPEGVKNMSAGYTPGIPRLGVPAI